MAPRRTGESNQPKRVSLGPSLVRPARSSLRPTNESTPSVRERADRQQPRVPAVRVRPINKRREVGVATISAFGVDRQHHQAVGIRIRQWAKQQRIHDTEDGGVRPDTQREGEYGHGSEARVLQ